MARLTRGLSILVALAVGGAAAPAAAHAASCPSVAVAQTFAHWLDPAKYMSAPNGGFEAGGASWTLTGGAATVQDNEPWHVRAATDHVALALPTGAAAKTAAVCIGVDHPTTRLFVRNTGATASRLAVSVLYTGLNGKPASLSIGQLAGGTAWAPTPVVPVVVNLLSLLGDQHVAFRFAPVDALGHWRIDDVYIDPFGKS
jgi:hypothetical protein